MERFQKKNYYPSFGRDISFFIFQIIFLVSYIVSPLIYLWLILTDLNREISLILLILNFIPILIINIKFRYNFFFNIYSTNWDKYDAAFRDIIMEKHEVWKRFNMER